MAHGNNSRANANNHANQLNPNNAAYWSSRGISPTTSGTSSGGSSLASPPPKDDTTSGEQDGRK